MTLRLVPTNLTDPQDHLAGPALAAAAELSRPSPRHAVAVAWLSAHAAALEHVVHPAARRAGIDVAAQTELTRRLEHVLLQLHQALNGDGRGADVHVGSVVSRLKEVLAAHVPALQAVIAQLKESLTADDWTALVARHDAALGNGPSRPHPHTPHGRLGERFSFPIAGAVDRLLDALDSRVVPPVPVASDAAQVSAVPRPA